MTLKAILISLNKSQSKHTVSPHRPSVSWGTAFLDQQRLLPTTLEKHYIGSMLYAFNFAEETQRAEGGQPLKVIRMLAEDLGQGSYVHEPTDAPSPHESVHEMWEKMSFIQAKFTAIYGPGIVSASTSDSSDSSLSVYDDSSESDVMFDTIVDKRVLSTIEELSESSASVQAFPDNTNPMRSNFVSSSTELGTDLLPSISKEDLTITNLMSATHDLETLLQSSDLDATWLDYSVSSDTEEEDDATSSVDVLVEDLVETISPGGSLPNESNKYYFQDLPSGSTSPATPVRPTKSFVVLSGHKCTPALGFSIDNVLPLHSSDVSRTVNPLGDAPIIRESILVEHGLSDPEFFVSPSTRGSSTVRTDKKTFIGDVEIVLDVAEAFSKVDSLTGNRDLPDLSSKPRKAESMSNLFRKVFHRKQRLGSFDGVSFDLITVSSPSASPSPLSTSPAPKLSKWNINVTTKGPVNSDQRSMSSSRSSVSL